MDKNFRTILHLMIFCAIGLLTIGNPSDLYGQRRAPTGAEEKDHGHEEHHEIDPARFLEEMEEELTRLEAEWDRRREEINEHFEEWEADVERRRDREGRDFDEQGSRIERQHMERRRELELRVLKIDEDFARRNHELMKQEHEERQELEAEFRALDESAHQAGSERRRSEIDRHFAEWEVEQEERRVEEGEDFDEEFYELEREHMERRRELEVSQMELEEELHAEHIELDQQGLSESRERHARRDLERREERAREEMEADFRELEEEWAKEADQFWRNRDAQGHGHDEEWADDPGHGEDLDIDELQEIVDDVSGEYPGVGDLFSRLETSVQKELRGECGDCVEKDIQKVARFSSLRRLGGEEEQQLIDLAEHYAEVLRHELSDSREEDEDDEEGPWSSGPNSVRLVVASVDGDEVVVNIEIAESDPINGWGMQIAYDKDDLKFIQFIPGQFIGGNIVPLPVENDNGLSLGLAQLGGSGGWSEGDGVLGVFKLQITGSVPTSISVSNLIFKTDGDSENDTNLVTDQIEIDR